MKVTPKMLKEEVRNILENAGAGFLTAYDIVARLPQDTRQVLMSDRSRPGKGSGEYYSAASVVSQSAQLIGAEVDWLHGKDHKYFCGEGDYVEGGNEKVALYRINDKGKGSKKKEK